MSKSRLLKRGYAAVLAIAIFLSVFLMQEKIFQTAYIPLQILQSLKNMFLFGLKMSVYFPEFPG